MKPHHLPGGGSQYGEQSKEERAETAAEFVAAMKTRIHECEGCPQTSAEGLDDAEKLLERAASASTRGQHPDVIRVARSSGRIIERGILVLKMTLRIQECATVDVAVGLLMLCSDRLVTRLQIFLRLFDWDGDGFLGFEELLSALKCASRLLGGLGFLRRPAGDSECLVCHTMRPSRAKAKSSPSKMAGLAE